MSFVADLEPPEVWRHFDRILQIPRGSGSEEGMRRYVLEVVGRHGFSSRIDAAGNLVLAKPASPGREGAAGTVLQSHLDMVNEKDKGVAHDFSRDPIKPRRDGEWLKATGTTLGADNGVGVASMLAMLESRDVAHGPLELLFTVEEEVGLVGASKLDPSLVAGRRLLNLDSEEEGAVTVGCAGAAGSDLDLEVEEESVPAGAAALRVRLGGLKGGHSGLEIHLQRGNAVKLLARALAAALAERPFRLAAFTGGDKRNALAREAEALAVVAAGERRELAEAVERELEAIRAEHLPVEPDLRFEVVEEEAPARAWSAATTSRALALVEALPHGVLAMSHDIPGLVETSTNLASAMLRDGSLRLHLSSRSSVASALAAARRRIRAAASLAGATVDQPPGYPGWKPDLGSPLLALVRRVHERVLGSAPELKAVHAGLECGILGEKLPGMDMVSIGPRIESPHSPEERVDVPSVARFYGLLRTLLEEMAA
jgi:dipeptidase D